MAITLVVALGGNSDQVFALPALHILRLTLRWPVRVGEDVLSLPFLSFCSAINDKVASVRFEKEKELKKSYSWVETWYLLCRPAKVKIH